MIPLELGRNMGIRCVTCMECSICYEDWGWSFHGSLGLGETIHSRLLAGSEGQHHAYHDSYLPV